MGRCPKPRKGTCPLEPIKHGAVKLKAVRFDACYCSTKLRARQMAGELYAGKAVLDERLEEIVCGAFEGAEETPEAMQAFWEAMQTGASGVELLFFRQAGGV